LPVRGVIGLTACSRQSPKRPELLNNFQKFRDILQARAGALPGAGVSAELGAPAPSAGSRPRERPGAEAADADAPRRVSADPERALEPEPSPLEPLAVLLGSFAGVESRTSEPAGALPDRVVSDVVRSIAWGGNQRRGAARLELGGDRYGGTRLVVEVDGDELRLRVDAPPGVDSDELRARLAERFARRGLSLRDD
jgi:hypothetical protein